jgi:hypothetical protein
MCLLVKRAKHENELGGVVVKTKKQKRQTGLDVISFFNHGRRFKILFTSHTIHLLKSGWQPHTRVLPLGVFSNQKGKKKQSIKNFLVVL